MDSTEMVGWADITAMLIPYLVIVVLTIIPAVRILRRVGLSRAWALLTIIPPGGVLIFWIVAFRSWPLVEKNNA
jgi:hypothetical protein